MSTIGRPSGGGGAPLTGVGLNGGVTSGDNGIEVLKSVTGFPGTAQSINAYNLGAGPVPPGYRLAQIHAVVIENTLVDDWAFDLDVWREVYSPEWEGVQTVPFTFDAATPTVFDAGPDGGFSADPENHLVYDGLNEDPAFASRASHELWYVWLNQAATSVSGQEQDLLVNVAFEWEVA